MPSNSMIRLITLAPQGNQKIKWVREHMPILRQLEEEFSITRVFEDKNIVLRLHIEATTANLAIMLRRAGANVCLVEADPLTTQDDVAAALSEEGIRVLGQYGSNLEEHKKYQKEILKCKPHVIVDSGAILTKQLHEESAEYAENFIGTSEESITGVRRLEVMYEKKQLKYPVLAVNCSVSKHIFEDIHGTGQSVWSSITYTTNILVGGKTVVVIGYGWCGRGIAKVARGLGARVIVCELDPVRASEAMLKGFQVMPVVEAVKRGDYIVTATGNKEVINKEHLPYFKNRAILVNAGHSDVEIDKSALEEEAIKTKEVANNIRQYKFKDDRKVFLIAEGRVVNSASGDGQPAEVMDIGFAIHALAIKHLIECGEKCKAEVIKMPIELDQYVTDLYLETKGIDKDSMSGLQQQKSYWSDFTY
ncbi:adenosylhomocysteinase [Desulfitispora alkaliphila]|uniref:adenosylhomocysteinase n=1 Tax=Desulfitispora alkaliphila TaxID=622674 RepID=UPI003D19A4EC